VVAQKSRGVKRVDDRRVLNGIFWRLRTGAPWADIPARYGPHTTCVNRFNRWRRAGIWAMLLHEVSKAYRGDIQMIPLGDTIVSPVGSGQRINPRSPACSQWSKKSTRSRSMGRSRGGLTTG